MPDRGVQDVPRIALTRTEAAAALGMGATSFDQYVAPHVRMIRLGKIRVVTVDELERWAESVAQRHELGRAA